MKLASPKVPLNPPPPIVPTLLPRESGPAFGEHACAKYQASAQSVAPMIGLFEIVMYRLPVVQPSSAPVKRTSRKDAGQGATKLVAASRVGDAAACNPDGRTAQLKMNFESQPKRTATSAPAELCSVPLQVFGHARTFVGLSLLS